LLEPDVELDHAFPGDRAGYLCVIAGSVRLDAMELSAGDAMKVFGPETLILSGVADAELILIDVLVAYEPVGV